MKTWKMMLKNSLICKLPTNKRFVDYNTFQMLKKRFKSIYYK